MTRLMMLPRKTMMMTAQTMTRMTKTILTDSYIGWDVADYDIQRARDKELTLPTEKEELADGLIPRTIEYIFRNLLMESSRIETRQLRWQFLTEPSGRQE